MHSQGNPSSDAPTNNAEADGELPMFISATDRSGEYQRKYQISGSPSRDTESSIDN